jgi:hypothetical protein
MKGGAIIAAFLATALGGTGAGAQALVEWQEIVMPGVCTLRVAVPQGWNARLERSAPGGAEIRITPESGPRAEVSMKSLAPERALAVKRTGEIKAAVRTMGEAALPTAVEKKLVLERVDGTDGAGFFYSLTDNRRQPEAVEPRYVTQGIMAVGPLRLAVTVSAVEPGSAARVMAFDLLRTAECAGAKASRQ